MPETSFAGRFLVATPIIATPPFARSVVLLLEHDESGAIGVVLNQPTNLAVQDHLPEIDGVLSDPALVFLGGPVSSETAIALGRGNRADFLRPSALADVGIIDLEKPLDDLDDLRIFAGYAGWDPDQLEAELAEGAWWIVLADSSDVFAAETDDLWVRTIERAPGTIPLYATYPTDPSAN